MGPHEPTMMPVIVNSLLSNAPIKACLAQHKLRIRVSETSTERSVIFPMSSVAFFYLPVTSAGQSADIKLPQERTAVLQSIAKFVEVHGHSYVVMVSNNLCDKTFGFLTQIQTQHLSSRLQVIPAQSAAEAASAMVDIAKLQCRPLAGKMHSRFCLLLNRLLLEDKCPRLLAGLGLDTHQQQLVQDGIGSLSKLAVASESDLMDCALDHDTARVLTHFFRHS